jgi:hypothetical protein
MMRLKMLLGVLGVLALLLMSTSARADNQSREAGRHFQRGVDLYADGDFRGALVEFKKAYTVWPRANVLYDIGQTEYQLLDYASALKTMERYLAETGPNAAHRSDVEATVEILRGRVGRVALSIEGGGSGCEISIDDQPQGSASTDTPIMVSVGSRKIGVSCSGRTASRRVEVAAGEIVRVELSPPPPPIAAVQAAMDRPHAPVVPTSRGMIIGWTLTGILLGGTIGLGVAALVENSNLTAMRNSFPISRPTLDHQSSLTTGLAIGADVTGAVTIVAAGVSTWLTVKYAKERRVHIGLAGAGASLSTNF